MEDWGNESFTNKNSAKSHDTSKQNYRMKFLCNQLHEAFLTIGRAMILLLNTLERRNVDAAIAHEQIKKLKDEIYYRHWRYSSRRW